MTGIQVQILSTLQIYMKKKTAYEHIVDVQKKYDSGEVIPTCFYCQRPDCYIFSVYTDPVTKNETFVKTYWTDQHEVVCKRCHHFMVGLGVPITIFFHSLLRTLIFFEKIIKFIFII